jgi:hypothetical protein
VSLLSFGDVRFRLSTCLANCTLHNFDQPQWEPGWLLEQSWDVNFLSHHRLLLLVLIGLGEHKEVPGFRRAFSVQVGFGDYIRERWLPVVQPITRPFDFPPKNTVLERPKQKKCSHDAQIA